MTAQAAGALIAAMRAFFALFATAGLLLPLDSAAAPLPKVGYRLEGTVGSWQPISAGDLARAIEQSSLEVLSKPGLMQLVKIDPKTATQPDYLLEIKGRLLDEAETMTVYLAFGAGQKSDLPSFNASETVTLGKLSRGALLEKIEQAAKIAAGRLIDNLKGPLQRAASAKIEAQKGDPFGGKDELPWSWAEVKIPSLKFSAGKADLYSKKAEERAAALRLYTSLLLLGDMSARVGLENCVLKHDNEDMRLGCLKALAPAARKNEPTRRVVIEAFRKDKSSDVKKEASEQMEYFTGFARAEAVQAWLESAANGTVFGPLKKLGDIPNLDLAIYRCMVACGKKEKYQRSKAACIELLEPLGHARRRAILWRFVEEFNVDSPYYLEGMGEREGSHGTEWAWALDKLLELAPTWDPALEDILWKRYQRTLSDAAMDALTGYGAPSPRLADRLLEALQTGGHNQVIFALERMGKSDPALAPKIRDKVAELAATGNYPKTIRKQQLDELIKDLGPKQ